MSSKSPDTWAGKTTMGMPPLKVGGQEYNVGRIIMFALGVGLSVQTFVWGPYDDKVFFGMKLVFSLLLISPELLKPVASFWKSRNG